MSDTKKIKGHASLCEPSTTMYVFDDTIPADWSDAPDKWPSATLIIHPGAHEEVYSTSDVEKAIERVGIGGSDLARDIMYALRNPAQ